MTQQATMTLTMREAADAAGFSRNRMYQLMYDGKLRTIKTGRNRRVTRQALTDCIAQLERETAPNTAP